MKTLITAILLSLSLNASAATVPDWMKTTANDGKKFTCSKRYCKNMTSCSEANFHWKQCPKGGKLDRDGDDVPCENVCGKTTGVMQQRLKQGQ